MPQETAHGSTQAKNGHGNVSFSELARAHYDWDRKPEKQGADRFHEALDAFEQEAGEIVDAYWCRKDASAVALTLRRRPPRGRLARLRSGEQRRLPPLPALRLGHGRGSAISPTCCTTATSSRSRRRGARGGAAGGRDAVADGRRGARPRLRRAARDGSREPRELRPFVERQRASCAGSRPTTTAPARSARASATSGDARSASCSSCCSRSRPGGCSRSSASATADATAGEFYACGAAGASGRW